MKYLERISSHFADHLFVVGSFAELHSSLISDVAVQLAEVLLNQGTIFWCGNGGSAADSQHLAAELVGRFQGNRRALRSVALTSDTSVLTCVANDYGYEEVFSRQLEALARKSDILIVFSTSGNSENILQVLKVAKHIGVQTIAFLGKDGGKAKTLADQVILIPSDSTARIQEAHILIGHVICDLIERELNIA
ncbi:MAG: phosphoheptose isomerase [Flavobacteriales bacterium]|nr:phosphoheptose isomerase [Flavobacteriales bacterium]